MKKSDLAVCFLLALFLLACGKNTENADAASRNEEAPASETPKGAKEETA